MRTRGRSEGVDRALQRQALGGIPRSVGESFHGGPVDGDVDRGHRVQRGGRPAGSERQLTSGLGNARVRPRPGGPFAAHAAHQRVEACLARRGLQRLERRNHLEPAQPRQIGSGDECGVLQSMAAFALRKRIGPHRVLVGIERHAGGAVASRRGRDLPPARVEQARDTVQIVWGHGCVDGRRISACSRTAPASRPRRTRSVHRAQSGHCPP